MKNLIRYIVAAAAVLSAVESAPATTYLTSSLICSTNPPLGIDVGNINFSIVDSQIRYSAYVFSTVTSIDIEIGETYSFIADTWVDVSVGGSAIPILWILSRRRGDNQLAKL